MKVYKIEEIKDTLLRDIISRKITESKSIKSFRFCDYTDLNFVMVVVAYDESEEKEKISKLIKDCSAFFYTEARTKRGTRVFKQLDNVKEQIDFCKKYILG